MKQTITTFVRRMFRMAQENPEPEVMEAEAADEQAENPDFVPVEDAPEKQERAPIVDEVAKAVVEDMAAANPAPVLFPDVYAAASQAFADSRANIAAKEKAVADNEAAAEALAAAQIDLEERHRQEMDAHNARVTALVAQGATAAAQLEKAKEADKEAARALIAVLQSYVA